MRANRFPTVDEVLEPIPKSKTRALREKTPKAILLAEIATECFLGETICPKSCQESILMGVSEIVLKDFPARNITIQGVGKNKYDVLAKYGLIYPDLPSEVYQVSYEVGYEAGDVPAIVRELVEKLARYYLLRDVDLLEDLKILIKVGQAERVDLEKKRHEVQTHEAFRGKVVRVW